LESASSSNLKEGASVGTVAATTITARLTEMQEVGEQRKEKEKIRFHTLSEFYASFPFLEPELKSFWSSICM
jgi:hypothetical protein